ncbi:armadillo-type protein [Suillus fuscotomentosus]|uniref:Armadillo-type protein n=1 Tax=Suillus fuscotomentosus TaxID=1912939 RepID=A0AAD4HPH2_9AGAM|nr:armadillo-type protein [Suillus fuscotomentosus]KAG1904032.1 armadillo-type protein [Suillus fuscotomentosus]
MESKGIEELDENQLTADSGELYLFQWLSNLERSLRHASTETLKETQASVEATLLKVLIPSEPYPSPGRPLRSLAARCLLVLYHRGESRSLFDTLRVLLKPASDIKATDKDSTRIAAFWTIGELMEAFGSQFMSFMAETATIAIKTLRSSASPHVRYHALTMLRKTLVSAKKALSDSLAKDIIKQTKNGLTDKALPVQRAAAAVLMIVYTPEDSVTLADVESIMNICVKSLEHSDQVTTQSLAQLAGHMLAATQMERAVAVTEQSQKGKKEQEDSDISTPAHIAAENTKILLTPGDMLSQISTQFNKSHSRKTRAGIFMFYVTLLAKLGPVFVESNYSLLVSHLMTEIVSYPKNGATRYDKLFIRKLVGALLRELIALRMLTEQGQIVAIQDLSSSYLKRWPALMPGQVAPSSSILTIALEEVAGLLQQLGNAPPPVQDAVSVPLMTLLTHPSHSVRVNASWTLRCFCYSTPLRLPKAMLAIAESLQRDIESLQSPAAPSDIDRRTLGHSYGLAALVAIVPHRPLYVSFDVSASVLDTATQLLKRASDHDIHIAAVEVEVAWTLIASLMLLGPNFVRSHLPQLLVLWRNALPKPTAKDNVSGRSAAEWKFLLHVRESALGAILCFLLHNSQLTTLDVARRISSLLGNALSFSNVFLSQSIEEVSGPSVIEDTGPSIRTREASLRRRAYQCFSALGTSTLTDSVQSSLLQSVLTVFAGPDIDNISAMQASIASTSGSFTSIWQMTDGYAYGLTTLEISEDGVDQSTTSEKEESRSFNAPPPVSSVCDAAIELFSQLLPAQDLSTTLRTISHLIESNRSPKLDKNAGRRTAVMLNSVVAIVRTLRVAMISYHRQSKDTLGHSQVTSALGAFLKDALVDGDPALRSASSEAIGRLANISGSSFLTSQTKVLVDHIVSNRDPQGRAGCALAFGSLYSHVGGLAAAPILKTTVNLLMSLSNDSHPLVHFWSLRALGHVINAASLAFAPFVSSTLGMLLKIYLSDTHEAEGGTLNNANIGGDLQAYPLVCYILDAIITILGPDVHDSLRTRTIVLDLVHEFSVEDDEPILVEAIRCIQHLLMFAPEHVDVPEIVNRFRRHLSSPRRCLKLAAIDALYQLVQKDALAMSRLGGDSLVEDLFGMLDGDPSIDGVRNVISSWLLQTAIHNPSAWIDLCQRIMLRINASQKVVNTANSLMDDEGQSLSASMSNDDTRQSNIAMVATSRWRTQLFALRCLHEICTLVARFGRREHIDIPFARSHGIPVNGLLVSRVPDLIKMAFTASAAYVTEIRLEGLVVLRDVIQVFCQAPDPDYPDALLLEQHQAPITAALTPAFSPDSTPEILSSAIDACAVFVGCGVVKDVSRMGRILKQLTTALGEVDESGNLTMGNFVDLSPNASGMLRVSILSAWARLEIASSEQTYLLDVIKPYRSILAPQWIASLRDYAVIRADSEFIHDASAVALDPSYASLGKVVLLPYYTSSWATILQAVANAMNRSDQSISAAILGKEVGSSVNGIDSTAEGPAPLFFPLFGLIYEALATSSPDTSSRIDTVIACLGALKCLLEPRYSGKALLEPTIFQEFMSLSHRIAMTESAEVLIHLIVVLTTFAKHFGQYSSSKESQSNTTIPPDSVSTHCLKIFAYTIRHSRHNPGTSSIKGDLSDITKMISGSLSAFHLIASTTELVVREDVRGIGCVLYGELLKDETSEADLITPTLPAFKSLLAIPCHPSVRERYRKLIHGLLSSCLLNADEMRGREGLISSRKVKTNLLAAVLILTVIPPQVAVSRDVVEHLFFLISQKLEEGDQMAIVAVHCAKTLAIAASGSELLRACVRLLLPALIQYVAKMVPRVDDGTVSEQQAISIDEVWKTFATLVSLAKEEQRSRLLSVLLPTITLLLRPSQMPPSTIHSSGIAHLLSLAASSPVSFKEATTQLDPSVREVLEMSIRKAVEGAAGTVQQSMKPQISLRSF